MGNVTTNKMHYRNNPSELVAYADIPCLKNMFFASGITTVGEIADAARTYTTLAPSLVNNGDGTFDSEALTQSGFTGGLENHGVKDLVAVITAKSFGTAGIALKYGSNSGDNRLNLTSFTTAGAAPAFEALNAYVPIDTLDAIAEDTYYTLIGTYDRDGNASYYQYSEAGVLISSTTPISIAADAAIDWDNSILDKIAIKGLSVAGAALFAFTEGIPSDVIEVCLDLAENWRNGIEKRPPEWVDKI